MTDISGLNRCIEKLMRCESISERAAKGLCKKGKEILLKDPNILNLQTPITVCGNIHGQFYDLLELFRVAGEAPDTSFLFLGDYVDRGYCSVETFFLLLALKLRYPQRVALLRGHHESRHVSQVFGFYDECLRTYGSVNIWKECMSVFDALPLAAIINGKVFCVHGGISPHTIALSDIDLIDRNKDVLSNKIMTDLLWSDPEEEHSSKGYRHSPRDFGNVFSEDVLTNFIFVNDIVYVCRAHQLVKEGYRKHFGNTVITIWSAPNYCPRYKNLAAVMELDSCHENPEFLVFEQAPKEVTCPQGPQPEYFL